MNGVLQLNSSFKWNCPILKLAYPVTPEDMFFSDKMY